MTGTLRGHPTDTPMEIPMPHHSFRTTLTSFPLALAFSLVVAAGASAQVATLAGPDATSSPAPSEDGVGVEFTDREEALLAYAQCMRDNGIEMDDPAVGGGGRGFLRAGSGPRGGFDELDKGFELAREACSPILEAARPEVDPVAERERLEEQLALAQCLRENGFPEYPDPAVDADGRLQRGGRQPSQDGIDRRSEAFISARTTCADQLGVEQFGPGGGAGGGAGGFGRGGD